MLSKLFKKSKKEKNNSAVVKLNTKALNQVVGGGEPIRGIDIILEDNPGGGNR